MESDDLDFNRVCRSCKVESRDMRLIFKKHCESETKHPRLDEMLMACASIQITLTDNLPKSICETCVGQLKAAFRFKQRCEESDVIFRRLAKSRDSPSSKQDLSELPSTAKQIYKDKQSNGVKNGSNHLTNNVKRYKAEKIDFSNGGLNHEDNSEVRMRLHDDESHLSPTLDSLDNCESFIVDDDSENEEENIMVTPDLPTYSNEDLGEMMEEKAKIEDINESRTGGVEIDSDNIQSTKPVSELKKIRGRPRKHPVKLVSGRPRGRPPAVKISTEPDEPHACPQCNEVFPKITLLEKHALTHDGFKLYECDVCSKKYARADQMKRHKLSHNKVKPFTCEICGKGFKRRDYFAQHVEMHSRTEEFPCENCHRVFKKIEQLTKHMAAEHFSAMLWHHSIATIDQNLQVGCSTSVN